MPCSFQVSANIIFPSKCRTARIMYQIVSFLTRGLCASLLILRCQVLSSLDSSRGPSQRGHCLTVWVGMARRQHRNTPNSEDQLYLGHDIVCFGRYVLILRRNLLPPYSGQTSQFILKIEAASFFETLIRIYHATWLDSLGCHGYGAWSFVSVRLVNTVSQLTVPNVLRFMICRQHKVKYGNFI